MTDLRWTRETPTERGWYWIRSHDWATDRMGEVVFVDPDADVVEWAGEERSGSLEQMVGRNLWAGPIPEPEEDDRARVCTAVVSPDAPKHTTEPRTSAPAHTDDEAAPDPALLEELSQWLRRGAYPCECGLDLKQASVEPCGCSGTFRLNMADEVDAALHALAAERDALRQQEIRDALEGIKGWDEAGNWLTLTPDPDGQPYFPILPGAAKRVVNVLTRGGEEIDKLAYSNGCLREVIDRQQETNAALRARVKELEEKYEELLLEVVNRTPGVSRHDRAREIIRSWECASSDPCAGSEGGPR